VGALLELSLAAAIALQAAPVAGATIDEPPVLTRVKAADPEMRRLVLDGRSRSATFGTLLDELERSDAIVVVQFGECANGRIRSCVSNVSRDARLRFIRIKVSTRTTDDRLIATIAHELQHAVEIVRVPEVGSAAEALALYRRIATGRCRDGLSDRCETDAAIRLEALVNDELSRSPR
jgi:hypothetical protein